MHFWFLLGLLSCCICATLVENPSVEFTTPDSDPNRLDPADVAVQVNVFANLSEVICRRKKS